MHPRYCVPLSSLHCLSDERYSHGSTRASSRIRVEALLGGALLDTSGKHLLIEYYGCDRATLGDAVRIEALIRDAARAAGATVVGAVMHRFSPTGVSGVLLLEESHLSIHTWPEEQYAAVDLYTCGSGVPERAHELMHDALSAKHSQCLVVERGRGRDLTTQEPAFRTLRSSPYVGEPRVSRS